jgi:hypothetical protein
MRNYAPGSVGSCALQQAGIGDLTGGSIVLPWAMSQPVKLSDALVLDARLTAEIAQRSIAGQIEFWASLGKAVESLLRGRESLALRKTNAVRPLSECLQSVDSPAGRRRVANHLQARPLPHYEAAPGHPGLVMRIEANGRRTLGRFVKRRFQPVPAKKRR